MKLGIILPASYSGGTLRAALNAAIQIHDGARALGDDVAVEFGYVDVGQAEFHKAFRELERREIPYRPLRIEFCDARSLFSVPSGAGREELKQRYVIFNDGVSNFDDADFLLIMSDQIIGGVMPPGRRFGMVIYDLIQRYVPEIFDGATLAEADTQARWRAHTAKMKNYARATALFVTTDQTRSDVISFGGVPGRKVVKLPMEFDPLDAGPTLPAEPKPSFRPYMVWPTNSTQHKNHIRMVRALELMYSQLTNAPDVIMTGQYSEFFTPGKQGSIADIAYVRQVREEIRKSTILSKRLRILGEVPDHQYLVVVRGAFLLLHPALFDNGTFSVVEAAWQGVPSVSSRYAAMDEINRRFELNLCFFDALDENEIAKTICAAIGRREELKARLPPQQRLTRFRREENAIAYWIAMRPIVMGTATP